MCAVISFFLEPEFKVIQCVFLEVQ